MTDWADIRQAIREAGLTIHLKHSAADRRRASTWTDHDLQLWAVRDEDGYMVVDFDHEQGRTLMTLIGPDGVRTLADPSPIEALTAAREAGLAVEEKATVR
jgi:hypothetical protein